MLRLAAVFSRASACARSVFDRRLSALCLIASALANAFSTVDLRGAPEPPKKKKNESRSEASHVTDDLHNRK